MPWNVLPHLGRTRRVGRLGTGTDRRAETDQRCSSHELADTVVALMRKVTLEIAGARYKLTTDAEEGHLAALASAVNERIEALGAGARRAGSPAQLLAVVALGLAEDLVAANDRANAVENLARETIARAIERIDLRLTEDAELARRESRETGGEAG